MTKPNGREVSLRPPPSRVDRRNARKTRYQDYQHRAQTVAEGLPGVTVPKSPNVSLVAGGAFVDAILWVPEEEA